jgi:hypothetical protein
MPNKRWMENKIKSLELKWIIIIIGIIWKNYKYNYSFLNKINSTSMCQKIFFQFLLNWLFFDLSFEFTSNFSLYYISLIFSTTQKYFF